MATTRVQGAAREVCAKCESVTGVPYGRGRGDSYVFRLTQATCVSLSVYGPSDLENENGVKIENGIQFLGNSSRSGLGRIRPKLSKTRSTD